MAIPFSQANLALLDRAIASGVKSIEIDGHVTTWRTMDEMMAVRALMEASLTNTQRKQPLDRARYASFRNFDE